MHNLRKSFLFAAFSTLAFLPNSRAMDFNWGQLKTLFAGLTEKDVKFQTPGLKKRCGELFVRNNKVNFYHVTMGGPNVARMELDGETDINMEKAGGVTQKEVATNRPYDLLQEFFQEAMSQGWRTKNSSEGVNRLEVINSELAPARVGWAQYKLTPEMMETFPEALPPTFFGVATVRSFDGSYPFMRIPGHKVSYEEGKPGGLDAHLGPIERSNENRRANYRLPRFGRDPNKNFYIWHVGAGTNQKTFKHGIRSVFSNLAQNLDNTYNGIQFKTFNQTNRIEEYQMMVVSSAKAVLVPHYMEMGFKVYHPYSGKEVDPKVYVVDSNGQAKETLHYPTLPDGMVLIGMTGAQFIRSFMDGRSLPDISFEGENGSFHIGPKQTKDSKAPAEVFLATNQKAFLKHEDYGSQQEALKRLNEVEKYFFDYAHALIAYAQAKPQIQRLEMPEFEILWNDPQWRDLVRKFRRFAVNNYTFLNNLPGAKRLPQWDLLDALSTSLLTDYPLEAWPNLDSNPSQTRLMYFEVLEHGIRHNWQGAN